MTVSDERLGVGIINSLLLLFPADGGSGGIASDWATRTTSFFRGLSAFEERWATVVRVIHADTFLKNLFFFLTMHHKRCYHRHMEFDTITLFPLYYLFISLFLSCTN